MLVRHSLRHEPSLRPLPYQRYGKVPPRTSETPSPRQLQCQSLLSALRSNNHAPIILRHKEAAEKAVKDILSSHSGKVIYAMKPNRSSWLLRMFWENGIKSFLVTNLSEMHQLRELFDHPQMNFMHPVKNEMVIQQAYAEFGVRTFALDSEDELLKIRRATQTPASKKRDLTLCVRIAVDSNTACLPLTGKFGVAGRTAKSLLQQTREVAKRLGICFSIGSQCMDPADYEAAVGAAAQLVTDAGVAIDVLDVGGGMPVPYPGLNPPPRLEYCRRILRAIRDQSVFRNTEIWWEPGRDLSARAESLVMRVELVRDGCIHANDGLYGRLHDPARYGWPVEMILLRDSQADLKSFSLAGPTLDSEDQWENACRLPGDVSIGDHIWVRNIGAYGKALSTDFDGYREDIQELDIEDSDVVIAATSAQWSSA